MEVSKHQYGSKFWQSVHTVGCWKVENKTKKTLDRQTVYETGEREHVSQRARESECPSQSELVSQSQSELTRTSAIQGWQKPPQSALSMPPQLKTTPSESAPARQTEQSHQHTSGVTQTSGINGKDVSHWFSIKGSDPTDDYICSLHWLLSCPSGHLVISTVCAEL